MSSNQKVIVPAEVKAAVQEARGESKAPAAYVVVSYSNVNTLNVLGTGAGGVDEALQLLADNEVCYIFLRKDMKVEMAKTTKFVLLTWCPNTVKPMRRSLIATHKGQIRDTFNPVHVALDFNTKNEMSEEVVGKQLGIVAGTASHVTEKKEEKKEEVKAEEPKVEEPKPVEEKKEEKKVEARPVHVAKPTTTPASQKFIAGPTGSIPVDDEKAFKDATSAIRDDKSSTTWLLLGFRGDNKQQSMHFIGSGEGTADAMAARLETENPCLGLVRINEMVDNKSKTTKFVQVRYVPQNTKPMVKAALTAKKGAMDKLFQPFLLDVTIEKPEELTVKLIEDRVANASGTKSHIIHRD